MGTAGTVNFSCCRSKSSYNVTRIRDGLVQLQKLRSENESTWLARLWPTARIHAARDELHFAMFFSIF
jgi:hypothetical protein